MRSTKNKGIFNQWRKQVQSWRKKVKVYYMAVQKLLRLPEIWRTQETCDIYLYIACSICHLDMKMWGVKCKNWLVYGKNDICKKLKSQLLFSDRSILYPNKIPFDNCAHFSGSCQCFMGSSLQKTSVTELLGHSFITLSFAKWREKTSPNRL